MLSLWDPIQETSILMTNQQGEKKFCADDEWKDEVATLLYLEATDPESRSKGNSDAFRTKLFNAFYQVELVAIEKERARTALESSEICHKHYMSSTNRDVLDTLWEVQKEILAMGISPTQDTSKSDVE